jgi:hypothetical protein
MVAVRLHGGQKYRLGYRWRGGGSPSPPWLFENETALPKPLGEVVPADTPGWDDKYLTASARAPSPRPPPPLRGRGGEFDRATARLRAGEGGACLSHPIIRSTEISAKPPLPRSWGRGRPPLRGTSERSGGGEGLPRSGPWGKTFPHPSPAEIAPNPLVPRGGARNGNGEPRRASRRALTPGPSPANCAGEGRIRSRYGKVGVPFSLPHAVCGVGPGRGAPASRIQSSEAPRSRPNHPSPEVGGGVARRREERAKGRAGERASREAGRGKPSLIRHPLKPPSPLVPRGEGENCECGSRINPLPRRKAWGCTPSPAQFAGEGAAPGPRVRARQGVYPRAEVD